MRSAWLALLPIFASALFACSSDTAGTNGSDASLSDAAGDDLDGASSHEATSDGMTANVDAPDTRVADGMAPVDAARDATIPFDAEAGGATPAGDATDATPPTDGDLPDPLGPVPDGGALVQFVASDESVAFDESQEEHSTGTIAFGVSSPAASDGKVATLTRTGGQATLGTGGAEEIVSRAPFSFGTFRYRIQLASCAATEEAVNGLFTYFNDGTKATDGLIVNREVDIEILCGEPWLINLTIWTEYTDDTHLENQSRVVDTRTGTVYVYADDTSGNQTGTESHPELALAGFPSSGTYYEMGFTWAPDHLRYFISNGGTDVTLWDATDATRIPQAPMEQHFNLWAPGEHWSTGESAAVPAQDATLSLDWFRYDPL
ncbi:MAG TPA: glycoside hydrolase family 16 protein [Polyangiaceae bacterium]|nr:glycoside hydrolase family 16 protein [Polyangiaceae bacterium]